MKSPITRPSWGTSEPTWDEPAADVPATAFPCCEEDAVGTCCGGRPRPCRRDPPGTMPPRS
ncbi:hypothetical protein ABT383_42130, partial [Streptomyces humidus]|uniref:hypothetical protein n=1 Tax=Streptomyces humidus TaxID=52259 RepID=UPI00332F768E